MSRRATRAPKLETLLQPIHDFLQENPPNAYSAHQKALTTTARLVLHGNGALAIEVLSTSARELLKIGEAASGAELGVRMVEIMEQTHVKVDDKSRAMVTQLLALTLPTGNWRKKFADAAIKWSAKEGDCPTGDPSLHQYLGELYYKDRLYIPAEQHLLASGKRDAATLLAELMFQWCEKGALDPGPYAVRGVLPHLTNSPPNLLPATAFLTRFLSLLQSSASAYPASNFYGPTPGPTASDAQVQITASPTLNFLQLALATIQRAPAPGASAVQARGMDGGVAREWTTLVTRYRRVAGTDSVLAQPAVQEALAAISANVFLIPQRNSGNSDLFSLMGSLFGGGGGAAGIGAR